MSRLNVLLILCFVSAIVFNPAISSAQDDLTVMKSWRGYYGIDDAIYRQIADDAYRYLDQREAKISGLGTEAEWHEYIGSARDRIQAAFGPLPEKTPLNARIVDTVEHLDFTVEKIVYESRPGFYVTAALVKRADSTGPLPAILYLCGHTLDGYKGAYQTPVLNLARKGFAVLAIDPVGQGERRQYTDEEHIGGPTNEHSYPGLQYVLLGRTMGMVRLWDGIRAVDYLTTRADVDASRIGVVGRSGGGTMSTYLGAMDDRIAAAAPTNYITSFRRLFQSIGPQDAEQNLLDEIKLGIDHGDFLLARAPKPTLVVSTTRDFFSIQGAMETAESVRSAFEAMGAGEKFDFIYDDAGHAPTPLNRKRMYAFFMETFGVTGDPAEEDIPHLAEDALFSTPNGSVIEAGSRSVHDLILEDAGPVLETLAAARKDLPAHLKAVKIASLRMSGYDLQEEISETILTGRIPHDVYTIETYILESESAIPLPVLLFIPVGEGPFPAVLLFDEKGKAARAGQDGMIQSLVRAGNMVLTVDLPGFGELAYRIPAGEGVKTDDAVVQGASYNILFGAQLVGRSITGIQAGAVSRALKVLSARDDVDTSQIHAVSTGLTGPALMHAAAHETMIRSAVYIGSPLSWESVIRHRLYNSAIGSTMVPSALTAYDLPDLISLAAPRRAAIIAPVDGNGEPAPSALQSHVMDVVRPAFNEPDGSVVILPSGTQERYDGVVLDFIGKNK